MRLSAYIFVLLMFASIPCLVQWGVKGGIDYGAVPAIYSFTYRVGFHAGATYDIPLSSKMYFQTGALFGLQSFGFHMTQGWIIIEDKNEELAKKVSKVDNYNIEIPATLSFRPEINSQKHIRLIADLGLYVKYGLFGNVKYYDVDNTVYEGATFKDDRDYNRLLIGINAGTGVQFDKIYTCFGVQCGLTGIMPQSNLRNVIFRLSTGYRF
jgi:hypothetical protein